MFSAFSVAPRSPRAYKIVARECIEPILIYSSPCKGGLAREIFPANPPLSRSYGWQTESAARKPLAPLPVSTGLTVLRFAFAPSVDGVLRPKAAASRQEPFGCARDRIQPCMLASTWIGPDVALFLLAFSLANSKVQIENVSRWFNPRLQHLIFRPQLQVVMKFIRDGVGR